MNRLLIASLDRFGPLRDSVRDDLMACSQEAERFEPGQVIAPAGARSQLRLLARGLAVKQEMLPSGGRQIFGIATPGDIVDLGGLYVGLDYEVRALGVCEVRKTTTHELRTMARAHPNLLAALCRAALTEAQQQRGWMVGLGRRTALGRAANLFCEIYWRQTALRLAGDGKCDFPAVQADIADALGLSVVHVHRVLRALRDEGLATLRHGVLKIEDWDRLANLGGFDAERLRPQQESAQAAAP
ncbi:Crp/Fnr family transcriptional regulator [Caulobacter segnis]|uniref:Crp/Fnr family transcriptional regulator n=2 Tax=Caulobacter segnis TaxID=88688 RepID=A0ABN5IY53_9CAUL|nr:Crp/Fnr family transcriptional regulator [Caulobacter segnis]ADG11717.1 putative transcriptional regulator, Crp/Fnr family [Caulobacter segnis ATCC 21756]AVQ03358.1 Crp/Fnr family transcriptional regulator [Caulobacter segnis]